MQIHQDSRAAVKYFEYSKYNSSILSSYLLDPIAQKMLPCISENFNTNILSIMGVLVILFSYIFSLTFDISPISFIIHAMALQIYQLSDTLNQKVGIRDHTNSPLTLLIDHLCDHCICCLIVLTFCNLVQLQLSLEWIIFPLVSVLPFYSKYLNLYYLDKMVFDKVNPVDQGVIVLQIICWVSVPWPDIWLKEIAFFQLNKILLISVLILALLYIAKSVKEGQEVKDQKFSFSNMAPFITTLYIFFQYLYLNNPLLEDSTLVRLIEWSFILVHTLVIGRILIYHMMGQKFKPISLGYLLLVISNIIICSIIFLVDLQGKLVICNLLALIILVMSISYSLMWILNVIGTLNDIIKQ